MYIKFTLNISLFVYQKLIRYTEFVWALARTLLPVSDNKRAKRTARGGRVV